MRPLVRSVLVFLLLALVVTPAFAQDQDGDRAVITLGTDPMPPDCVANPDGSVTIFWTILHATVADHTTFRLYDPPRTTILDQQDYPGASGDNVTRQWTVPVGSVAGMYWVRVEYYAVGIGFEAAAETGFLVCETPPPPTADCCVGTDCYVVTEEQCAAMDGVWLPGNPDCSDDPCAPTPSDPLNWGSVKELFR